MKGKKIILCIIIFLVILSSGCTQDQNNESSGDNDTSSGQNGSSSNQNGQSRPDIKLWPYSQECTEITDLKFSASPIGLDDVTYILPMGGLTDTIGGHIIPGEHITVSYEAGPTLPPVDVHAVADGYLVMAERHVYTPYEGYPEDMRHYHLYFEHSCSIYTGYVHITEIDQDLLDANEDFKALDTKDLEVNENVYFRIPLTAGQVIGKAQAFGFIGMLTVDTDVTLTGYSIPDNYYGQPWRIHSVAPFDYFEEPLQSQIYEKLPRTSESRGGKVDFDIDGKLVGNWFQQGIDKWQATGIEGNCGNNVCPYWDGHLSFVYDLIEPEKIRINIGYDLNRGSGGEKLDGPYGVMGNSPNPADIGIVDGMVKYELVALIDVTLEHGIDPSYRGGPIFTANDESQVLATLLVQMIDDLTIKVEVFPGETAEGVSGFSENSALYER